MLKLKLFFGIFLILTSTSSHALCEKSPSIFKNACQRVEDTWTQGSNDIYVPFHAHHLEYAYSQEKIDTLNENSWGVGIGKSRYLDNGNWEGVYGMAFLDSHSDVEPMAGYAYQWMWGNKNALHAGLGYTVFITARSDIMNYVPFPAALPIASINYKKVSINTAFLPGGKGNGNILFFWSRFGF